MLLELLNISLKLSEIAMQPFVTAIVFLQVFLPCTEIFSKQDIHCLEYQLIIGWPASHQSSGEELACISPWNWLVLAVAELPSASALLSFLRVLYGFTIFPLKCLSC